MSQAWRGFAAIRAIAAEHGEVIACAQWRTDDTARALQLRMMMRDGRKSWGVWPCTHCVYGTGAAKRGCLPGCGVEVPQEVGSARRSSQGVATVSRQGRTGYALCLLTSDVR